MTSTIAVLTTFALYLGSIQLASAAEPEDPGVPAGTVSADPASSGTTEVEGQGKFAAADAEARESEDTTELDVSAGGLLSTGNAFTAAATGQGRFRLRRGIHQAGATVAGNFGRADVPLLDENGNAAGIERETTVSNLQGMLRYDVFIAKRWSTFMMATARRDRFQGLDLRLNLDPGVAVYVLTRAKHRLWFEAGYDFQFDIRRDDFIRDETGARVVEKTFVNHAARIFAGYNNSLSERVTFDTNIEYLQSVLAGSRFRINWVNALTTQLADRMGLSLTFTLRYENEPLPDVAKLDTITAVLLTVRFI